MEELGDVIWYLAELSTGLGEFMAAIMRGEFADYDRNIETKKKQKQLCLRRIILSMAANANAICEAADEGKLRHVEFLMRKMMFGAGNLAFMCGGSLQDAAEANIEKLKKRYPDGFDAQISMNRYV